MADGRHEFKINLQGDGHGNWSVGFAHGCVYRSALQRGLTDEQVMAFINNEVRDTLACITDNPKDAVKCDLCGKTECDGHIGEGFQ